MQCFASLPSAPTQSTSQPALPLHAVAAEAEDDPAGDRGGLRDFLLRERRGSSPLLMMVVALAAGQLRSSLDFGGEPRLEVQGGVVVSVEMMEVKPSSKGAPEALLLFPAVLPCERAARSMRAAARPHAAGARVGAAWHVLPGLPAAPRASACMPDESHAPHARAACRPRQCAELAEALQQLQVVGRVLVWMLHVANPKLLEAAGSAQLQLRGVLAVQESLAAEERQQCAQGLDVGCPGLDASMRLEVLRF